MKKIPIVIIVVAIAAMLTFPAILFAEEGDANSTVGVREKSGQAGQYVLGDRDGTSPDDTKGDSTIAEKTNSSGDGATGDGDTEVFCIDGDTSWDTGADEYTLTDIDVSDELIGEGAPLDDDDKDGTYYKNDSSIGTVDPHQIDGEIDPVEAEAIEILSKEATGATSVEDQEAVWRETGDNNSNRGDTTDRTAVIEAAEALATEFLDLAVNNDTDPDNDKTLDEFLDEQDINEIDVIVEQDDNIFLETTDPDHEAGTAIATMENPLVPGITDDGKNVYWYILGGAFNMSFSPDELVTEASSASPPAGTDATKMTDMEDDDDDDTLTVIDEDIVDNDNDGEIVDDNYGIATISYYYYHWGLDEHPEGTMGINLYAWVDVDEDELFDIVDLDPEKTAEDEGMEEDGVTLTDPDGDVVGDFQNNHQVVQTEAGEVKTDGDGNVETTPFAKSDMDVHKVEGGKVVIGHDNLLPAEEASPGNILPSSETERNITRQRFSTIAYTEPYDDDPIYYGTVVIKVNEKEDGLEGAVFGVFDNESGSGDPLETMTSNEDGFVSTSGLVWEGSGTTYYVRELSAPGGYDINKTIYEVFLSGAGVSVTTGDEEGNLPFIVTNKKTPPEEPEEPEEPDTPEGDITVEGLTVLAFTGYSSIYYIIGFLIILIGAVAAVALFRVQRKEQ